MPLPHAPLTAPGAQSTLNFTRVPVDSGVPLRERSATASGRSLAPELGGDGVTSSRTTASTAVEEPIDGVGSATVAPVEHVAVRAAEAPAHELVPDVPLDEYIQNFHYEPPSEPAEVTMRGDAPPVSGDKRGIVDAPDAGKTDSLPAPQTENIPIAVSSDTAESRLGLDPEPPAEAAAERPRFLDIGESSTEASSGTSTIVGPSFLGLSDAPQLGEEYGPVEDYEAAAPRKSHWRGWLAAAVLLIFGGLGWMEWRSQSHQTDNGPVEVIKAKVRNLTNGGQPQLADQPADNTTADTNPKPDMQVQEPPKPPAQNQAATPPQNTNAPPSSPAAASPAAAQTASTTVTPAPAKTPSAQNASPASNAKSGQYSPAAPSKTQTTTQASATKPKVARQDKSGDDDAAAAKPGGTGADELNKANNASDSAAQAAWLWKSTAKGNPDAPVLLADMYMKGKGVPRSCEQAVVLLKTAAAKENARARNRLASMYATGNCVQRNRVEAYRWLSSALVANPHSDWAQQNKNLIWQQMTPEEQAEAQKYR